MKKLFLICLVAILVLTSCMPPENEYTPDTDYELPETSDELYSYYNKVDRGMTKDEITEIFGEGEENTEIDNRIVKYLNEKRSAGVVIEYTYEGKVRAKTLFFGAKEALSRFSPQFDSDILYKIRENMLLSEAVEILGSSPLEINCEYSLNDPVGISNIFAWYNKDGRSYHLHTENGIIKKRVLYGTD